MPDVVLSFAMATRYALYRALVGFTCQAPIFALFYLSRGLDYRGLMALAVAFAAAKLCLDVPAGLLADRIGRRRALVARVTLEAASVAVLFDHRFMVSAILAGAGCAFSSGAEAALVFEQHGRNFQAVFGRAASWGFVSTAMAALVGGALATVSFELVYALRLAALGTAVVVAMGFVEPERRTEIPQRSEPPRRRGLLGVFLFVGIVGAVQIAALQLQQPFLRAAGVPLASLGLLYVGFQLVTAIGARWAHRLPGGLRLIAWLSAAGFAVMALPVGAVGVLGVLLLKFAHGVSLPAVGKALNERASPRHRAASLSFRSLFEGAALVAAAPALGWAADNVSLSSAFGLATLFLMPSMVLSEVACVSFDVSPSRVSSSSEPAGA